MNEREKEICDRLRYARKERGWTQAQFAHLLGITRDRLVSLEYGRNPVRFSIGEPACELLSICQRWLALGKPPKLGHVMLPYKLHQWIPSTFLFSRAYDDFIEDFVNDHFTDPDRPKLVSKEMEQKRLLTNITQIGKHPFVSFAELMKRLKSAVEARGKKAELAYFLDVPMPRISEWLSGRREPGGATTLRLLEWVLTEESKQYGLGRVTSATKAETQLRKQNETPKSGRKKS